MTSPVISLNDMNLTLSGNAGSVDILKGISLTVQKGETLGLIGPSGSGKSSLLMIMAGLENASSGGVSVMDNDLTTMNEDLMARFRRDHMGVVFQSLRPCALASFSFSFSSLTQRCKGTKTQRYWEMSAIFRIRGGYHYRPQKTLEPARLHLTVALFSWRGGLEPGITSHT